MSDDNLISEQTDLLRLDVYRDHASGRVYETEGAPRSPSDHYMGYRIETTTTLQFLGDPPNEYEGLATYSSYVSDERPIATVTTREKSDLHPPT